MKFLNGEERITKEVLCKRIVEHVFATVERRHGVTRRDPVQETIVTTLVECFLATLEAVEIA
jgi:hypothetical protein